MAVSAGGWKYYLPERQVAGPVESLLYERLDDRDKVRCNVCAFRCVIHPGHVGVCSVRHNVDGTLYTLNYRRATACHVDPIEKKPLFHFFPGSRTLSIAAPGCNFHCRFCQNWQISQMPLENDAIEGEPLEPSWIVDEALRLGCESIAFTYTEPTVFLEYAMEIGTLAKQRGLHNIFVSNGYQTPEAIDLISPWLDAINIDLKGFRDLPYLKVCRARLAPVLEAIQRFHDTGVWVEISTPVIPGHDDSPAEIREMARFITSVNRSIPWHILKFHPDYEMQDTPSTPTDTLLRAREIARAEGLRHVYIGNALVPGGADTRCHKCGKTLVRRAGLHLTDSKLWNGRCPACETRVAGVGMTERPPSGTSVPAGSLSLCG